MTQALSEAPIQPGDLLAGKYRVDQVLGSGGMGVVVAATHEQLHQKVAVKFLLPHVLHNSEAVERFLREARAAVQIKSEHVARVIDVGTLETGAPYMVMEFLEGTDLSDVLKQPSPVAIAEAVEYILQACEAIAEAHASEIVHRDLKPANLFRTTRKDGSPLIKVLDFGISKVKATEEMSLTKTSTMMGSPLYMSPEQMRSAKDVDPRTDIWSMGVILYELLAHKPPFEGEQMPELVAAILTSTPTPVRQLRAEVPEGLEQVIHGCLAKDPEYRFQTVADLAHALAPFGPEHARMSADRASKVLGGAGIALGGRPPSIHDDVPPPSQASTVANWGDTKSQVDVVPVRKSNTKTIAAIVIGTAVVLGAGGGLALALMGPGGDEPPAAAGEGPPEAPPVEAEEPKVEPEAEPAAEPEVAPAEPDAQAEPPPAVAPEVAAAAPPPTPAPKKVFRPKPAAKKVAAKKTTPKKTTPKKTTPKKPRNPLSIEIK